MREIKKLKNGKKVVFATGKFDDYCVFVVDKYGNKDAPHDETYFRELQAISKTMGDDKVYRDFLLIYDKTWAVIDKNVLNLIEIISNSYPSTHVEIVEQWFTVIYAGMVAEEMKQNARLRRRIKRLGMHQILVEDKTPEFSAKYSYDKSWFILDKEMKKLGF